MTRKCFFLTTVFIGVSFAFTEMVRSSDIRGKLHKERLKIRAYEGAPPVISHEVDELGRDNCLSCHKEGSGFKKGKRSPITPHPEWINCRQCHIVKQTSKEFISSLYKRAEKIKKILPPNLVAPPYIPHYMQNRTNCRVCHLSITAKKELVPGHGERTNCRQCHIQLQRKAPPFKPYQP